MTKIRIVQNASGSMERQDFPNIVGMSAKCYSSFIGIMWRRAEFLVCKLGIIIEMIDKQEANGSLPEMDALFPFLLS